MWQHIYIYMATYIVCCHICYTVIYVMCHENSVLIYIFYRLWNTLRTTENLLKIFKRPFLWCSASQHSLKLSLMINYRKWYVGLLYKGLYELHVGIDGRFEKTLFLFKLTHIGKHCVIIHSFQYLYYYRCYCWLNI